MRTAAVVIGGAAVSLVGALLLLPLPELGVPLLLLGLRLLGRRYAWARRANARVDAGWSAVRAWFHRQPRTVRVTVVVVLAAVAVGLVVVAVDAVAAHA